ncbi:uncharacterized protein [Dermacentor albipictus]|uniref:uncharacterized protein n=1 Tax=Dermacentor albipictus TaxID=60249 RepID=UPI0038FC1B02
MPCEEIGDGLTNLTIVHSSLQEWYMLITRSTETHVGMTKLLSKFYAQNETIWTVNTTARTKIFCKVDFVNRTTPKYTDFLRAYFLNGTLEKNSLQGTFTKIGFFSGNTTIFDAMLVGAKGGMYTSTEQLLYAYENYTCGIFRVSYMPLMRGSQYEVRVKQSTIFHPNASCVAKFLELSKKSGFTTLYNDSCQHT